MIIWIDGTYGVGKTSVTLVLEKILKKRNIEVLLSDSFFLKWLHKKFCGGGTLPQNNVQFIEYFRDIIEGKIEKEIIIDMSLTQHECKEMLYDYFNDNFKRFDAGFIFGAGVTFGHIFVGMNYELGLSNNLKDSDISQKNRNFSINLGYNF